ncbi:hypothetical protein SAMN05661012_02094 [Chitinophaga sancti]|uniref:Uncharacterized protein n=1 Tax=Chitinophaga sancti TaxID=1004 RepID=A0A1K1PP78_9BACT|nr:hypothetical protein SAMN05661012_02094 [Chitinophaga sancti]
MKVIDLKINYKGKKLSPEKIKECEIEKFEPQKSKKYSSITPNLQALNIHSSIPQTNNPKTPSLKFPPP